MKRTSNLSNKVVSRAEESLKNNIYDSTVDDGRITFTEYISAGAGTTIRGG